MDTRSCGVTEASVDTWMDDGGGGGDGVRVMDEEEAQALRSALSLAMALAVSIIFNIQTNYLHPTIHAKHHSTHTNAYTRVITFRECLYYQYITLHLQIECQ